MKVRNLVNNFKKTKVHKIACLFMLIFGTSLAQAEQRKFEMTIDEVTIKVAPKLDYKVFAFNGQVPGPLIHVKEGDDVEVFVTNNTSMPHTIHWHGFYMTNNWKNDGVPGVTQEVIEAGENYTYQWKAEKTGSLWYHCHSNVNEHVGVRGMWGAIIVDPKEPTALEKTVTKDVIIMFSTWSSSHADKFGEGGTPSDLVDYFSINGHSFPTTQPIRVKKGDVVRYRLYGAGEGLHSFHPHGHDMLITHKDGLPLAQPYEVDTLLIAPGERYDAIVTMNNPGRWVAHDHFDTHVTNAGKYPGGALLVTEYEGIPMDDWYVWKDKVYNADFYFSESMKKGYGMHDQSSFKGAPIERERRRRRSE
jgi:FtsP/CotA-like multicopper oxidase with cupredoxin domain